MCVCVDGGRKTGDPIGAATLLLRGFSSVKALLPEESRHLRVLVACRLAASSTLGAYSRQLVRECNEKAGVDINRFYLPWLVVVGGGGGSRYMLGKGDHYRALLSSSTLGLGPDARCHHINWGVGRGRLVSP